MVDDKIFFSLDFQIYKVSKNDIFNFLKAVNNISFPNKFSFETNEAIFNINKSEKEFRIVMRKEQKGFDKILESDVTIMAMYKTAKRSGFKCYFEPKYMN